MIKNITKVITSPIFIVVFVLSLVALLINYFSYYNEKKYESFYVIEYHENIDEYDAKIDTYNSILEELTIKTEDYESSSKYYEVSLKIYEKLKIKNIDYSNVYDMSFEKSNESIDYILRSTLLIIIISFINLFTIFYLIFSREFDDSKYSLIYEKRRTNIILKKILSCLTVCFVEINIIYFVNIIFGLSYNNSIKYVMVFDGDVHFIDMVTYIFNYNYLYVMYFSLVSFMIIWILGLMLNKSLKTLITIVALIAVVLFLSYFMKNLVPYIGLLIDFDIVALEYINLTRLFIIPLIIALIISIYKFEKKDL